MYKTTAISGSIEQFWSPEQISDSEFYMGAIHLLGETPCGNIPAPHYGIRRVDVSLVKQEALIEYAAGLQNLLG